MTRKLLACGIVAGPLFVGVSAVQAFTREGFDLGSHPVSLLSLGDLGWIQIANFVVSGALYVACALGMRRALRTGRGRTWGPLLIAMIGVGLVAAGVFVTDAGAGYPAGAPEGAPAHVSWHGILHEVGFALAFIGNTAAPLVLARRFAGARQWHWVVACVVSVVAAFAVAAWPDLDSLSVRLLLASAIQGGFLAALAVHLLPAAGGDATAPGERGSAPDLVATTSPLPTAP